MDAAEKLRAAGFNVTSAKSAKVPKNMTKVTGKDAEQTLRLIDALEDNDDVQNVYANFDIDESELEGLMS